MGGVQFGTALGWVGRGDGHGYMRAYTGPAAVHVDEAAARAAGEARAAYWHLCNTTDFGGYLAEQEYLAVEEAAPLEEAAAREEDHARA